MDPRLYEATLKGDVASFLILLDEDTLILDRAVAAVAKNPLHVAALFGHVEFANAILSRNPELARKLDSEQSSPLHLASARGHVEMVKELLKIDPDMCLVCDGDGRTPLHVAAMKGRVEVVKELVRAKGTATMVFTDHGEPLLHFCVNHDQYEIVRTLLNLVENGEDGEFVNMKDDDDNTILHLAVAKKHIKLTKFLLRRTKMSAEVNALNVHGFTALDVLLQNRKKSKDMELERILRRSGARRFRADATRRKNDSWTIQPLSPNKNRWKKHSDWLNETRSALMIVAVLIATVTFQAGFNPPGGLWQAESKTVEDETYGVGESIMAVKYPETYRVFSIFNGIAFVASSSIILLMISGFRLKRWIFIGTLMIITWLAVTSMMCTYCLASLTVSPISTVTIYGFSILGWLLLNGLLIAAHFFRFIRWLTRKLINPIYIWGLYIGPHFFRFIRWLTRKLINKPPSMDATIDNVDVESRIEHN